MEISWNFVSPKKWEPCVKILATIREFAITRDGSYPESLAMTVFNEAIFCNSFYRINNVPLP